MIHYFFAGKRERKHALNVCTKPLTRLTLIECSQLFIVVQGSRTVATAHWRNSI